MVADLRHYLDLSEDTPAPARRLAAQLGDIVRAATAADGGPAWQSALPCRRRPAHRTCPGRTMVQRPAAGGLVSWQCSRCDDTGTISSWQGSPFDLRRHASTAETTRAAKTTRATETTREVAVTDDVAAALRDLQLLDPDGERLVYGLRDHEGGAVLSASDTDLEDLVTAVAAEANHEPDRRRQQRLDRAFDTLNAALDTATESSW